MRALDQNLLHTGRQPQKAIESEKRRRGSSDGFVGPLALCFDAQVGARFGERDLDLPSADVRFDPTAAKGLAMNADEIALRIEALNAANGGGVGWYEDKGAYHLYLLETEAPITRLKPAGRSDEVRLGYWSHRRKWEDVDDMGGCVLPLDQALDHVANNSVFWTWT